MTQGQLLTDLRTAGEAGNVHRTVDPDSTEDRRGVLAIVVVSNGSDSGGSGDRPAPRLSNAMRR